MHAKGRSSLFGSLKDVGNEGLVGMQLGIRYGGNKDAAAAALSLSALLIGSRNQACAAGR